MNFLEKIVSQKYAEVEESSSRRSLETLKRAGRTQPLRDFKSALDQENIQIIAEIKQKSPSAGNLYENGDLAAVAQAYEKHGAAALSVLTDKPYFGGSLELLRRLKALVSLPVLRKDFIVTEYQVYESWTAGADAVLLIAEALQPVVLERLYHLARKLGLYVLLEFHRLESLEPLLSLEPDILGVNSRNLETMTTDLNHFNKAVKAFPRGVVKVAESGIHSAEALRFIQELGYNAALIGTAFMKTDSPGKTLLKFLEERQG